jgi:hypothetical protein
MTVTHPQPQGGNEVIKIAVTLTFKKTLLKLFKLSTHSHVFIRIEA